MEARQPKTLLEVKNLKQYFQAGKNKTVKAVDNVSLRIKKGTTYGLVGESGSGKSTIGRAVIRLYTPTGGSINFMGREIGGRISKADHQFVTTKMQMIFQDPMSCLNPRMKVMDIIAEGLDIHHLYGSKEEREDKVLKIMDRVGLSKDHANRYPHMFSGGQRQRIGIARAMVMEPEMIIADECISALDVSIQAQVINLMRELQKEMGTTYLFIAHDLSVVRYLSDEIGVIHRGHFVEAGKKKDIFEHPIHPYTRSLLSAVPTANPVTERKKISLSYDYKEMGIDYEKGSDHYITETHMVLGTDEEVAGWNK